jgi:tetratricopeptide (TPR) repeat protein
MTAAVLAAMWAGAAAAADDDKLEGPTQLFYTGNHYYKSQDYLKAVDQYVKILDTGIENGPLYYNIGNGFLKLGKVGYAILCYEKARRYMPHDSDLKANLAYARSLIDEAPEDAAGANPAVQALRKLYSDVSINAIALIALGTYLALLLLIAICIINPIVGRWLSSLAVLMGLIFALDAAAFGVRFYQEVVVKHGVVVKKSVEAKYEPIDKSTTFYEIREGSLVRVLKTKEGWRRIRRNDGKAGWVPRDSVEEI